MGHTKVIQSGNVLEVFEYEREIVQKSIFRKKQKRPTLGDLNLRYIRPDNARRRVKSFRRLVTSNMGGTTKPALLTLTMYEVVSLRRGYAALHKFFRRLRADQGKLFKYIAVPEFQKRGAVHFHIMIWGLPDEMMCRGYWQGKGKYKKFIHECPDEAKCERSTRYFQSLWQRGFVDSLVTDGSDKLVGYLSKYMSKSMSDDRLCGEKAYVVSHNVLRPVSFSSGTPLIYAQEIWDIDFATAQPMIEKEFSTQWLGKGRYRLFKI